MKPFRPLITIISLFLISFSVSSQTDSTYAERLGFPKGSRVVVMHVDDVGMSYESNQGAIETITKGVATTCSMMMPCPWIPGIFHYLKDHPDMDAGLHLTLTSEWKDYRWGPVSGPSKVPGLVDPEGAMWPTVEQVVQHATADEVDTEIHAQLEKSIHMGFRPTHLDSHMGTLFASPAFLERYLKLGMENKIPVMFPGGHNTLIAPQLKLFSITKEETSRVGKLLWDAGLPVIDDLENTSYAPHLPKGIEPTAENLKKYKTEFYINVMRSVKPGITYVIMHCTQVTDHFDKITDSGPIREGDYLAMLNPELKKVIEKEGIILITMRELMERRSRLK